MRIGKTISNANMAVSNLRGKIIGNVNIGVLYLENRKTIRNANKGVP